MRGHPWPHVRLSISDSWGRTFPLFGVKEERDGRRSCGLKTRRRRTEETDEKIEDG